MIDNVNHPQHYESQAIVLEPIDFYEKLPFCEGCALKYIFRAGHKKGSSELEDLKKAQWYINRSYLGLNIGEAAEEKFYRLVPFLEFSKSKILQTASRLSVDFGSFWSTLGLEINRRIKSLEEENGNRMDD
ncbi:DUF3310 domain-containing protein [Turicimonas muris]|uniref:DUF3310 domain-containing protein n=2 Tax=Turicimonas muris TaxID=1796652 RepID=UPI00248A91D5|nr:DUF3310 domain-containing protein [Turicimonas muris]